MGKNRPILVATLGYIIGIIWGLYFKTNIVSFYVLFYVFLIVAQFINNLKTKRRTFKFISISRIFRYIKLIFNLKSLIIIIIISSISNLIIVNLNSQYESLYSDVEEVEAIARIVDNGKQKQYKTVYKIKIEALNGKHKYKGTYLYLDVNSDLKLSFKYGDYINIVGKYKEPSKATNYGGFDYSQYLLTEKIYGTIELEQANILKQNSNNILFTISNNIFIKIKDNIQKNLSEEKANLLLGILLGYKEEISEDMQQNFRESNISHILAVSGLHVSYIVLVITNILEKIQGKRKSKLFTILLIVVYMFITKFSPSVVRAGIMAIISVVAKLTYNKNDIWTSISISILIILIYNPYLITSAGVLLSYGGTIGIIIFQKNISVVFQKIKAKSKIYKYKVNEINVKVINYIQEALSISFSVQLIIAPIMAKMFNTISVSFFITNLFISIIIGPIILLGFSFIISNLLFSNIFIMSLIPKAIKFILEKLLAFLILMSKLGKILPLNKIYIATPEMWKIILYYFFIWIFNVFYRISNRRKITIFQKRLINSKNLIKHLIRKKRKKITTVIACIVILIFIININPKDLRIYFIDVAQGDSTLIITPQNKSILIDGGGDENYDVGKNILLPYLLDRKLTTLDYVIISHFDNDHVRRNFIFNARNKDKRHNNCKTI